MARRRTSARPAAPERAEPARATGLGAEPRAVDGRPQWRAAWAAFGLVALTLVAYGPAYRAGFIWDDDDYVTENRALDDLGGLARIWLEPAAVPQYYPLTFTSLWIEHQLYGDRPAGYHVDNVLLHALNAVLAWRVLVALGIPGAWLAAAIFAVHPVHVESVAWITERKNVLSGAGYLAALLAKTVTCTLPVVLLLLCWWKRGRVTVGDARMTAPLFLLGLGLAAVTIWMEHTHVGARGADWDLSLPARVLIAGRALWFYAATLAWPHPLAFVYPRWTLDPTALLQWSYPVAAGAAGLAAWLLRDRIGRWPFVALAGFTVTLAPALGFVDVYPMRYTFVADHYQYLASLFLIAPAAALAATHLGDATRLRWVTAPLVALLAVLTWRHAETFRDPETLWRDVMAKNPTGTIAPINLGMWLQKVGRPTEAIAMLETALRLAPDDPEIHGNLGIVLAAVGRTGEARPHLERAVALAPSSPLAQNNLGNALAADGRLDEAAAHYRTAAGLDPRYADAENNLANVLVKSGKADEAIGHYEAALAADPRFVAAHANLAAVLTSLGRNDAAIAHYRAALALAPTNAEAARGLGAQLAARGAWDEAILHLSTAARLRPRHLESQYQLAAALAGAGRVDEAVVAYGHALELRPDSADLHNDLGIAFARRGDVDAAVAEFRRALALAPDYAEAKTNLAAAEAARRGAGASGSAAAPTAAATP